LISRSYRVTGDFNALVVAASAGGPHATLVATLQSVGATEWLKIANLTGLLQLLSAQGVNHTVFAPTNDAFDEFTPRTVWQS